MANCDALFAPNEVLSSEYSIRRLLMREDAETRMLVTFEEAPRFWVHLRRAPPIFTIFWGLSTVIGVMTLCIATRQIIKVVVAALPYRRRQRLVFLPTLAGLYVRLLLFFPLIALLTWSALLSLKFAEMFELLLHLYEVGCLLWFWGLMVTLLGGPETATSQLEELPPTKVLQAAPLTCCLPCLFQRRQWNENDLLLTYILVAQYGVFAIFSVLSIAISRGLVNIFSYLSVASLLCAMYGLIVMYKVARTSLRSYQPGVKFLLIKLAVFSYKALELILMIPSLVKPRDGIYGVDVMRSAWKAFLANIIALPLTCFACFAFPTSELTMYFEQTKRSDKLRDEDELSRSPSCQALTARANKSMFSDSDFLSSTSLTPEGDNTSCDDKTSKLPDECADISVHCQILPPPDISKSVRTPHRSVRKDAYDRLGNDRLGPQSCSEPKEEEEKSSNCVHNTSPQVQIISHDKANYP